MGHNMFSEIKKQLIHLLEMETSNNLKNNSACSTEQDESD